MGGCCLDNIGDLLGWVALQIDTVKEKWFNRGDAPSAAQAEAQAKVTVVKVAIHSNWPYVSLFTDASDQIAKHVNWQCTPAWDFIRTTHNSCSVANCFDVWSCSWISRVCNESAHHFCQLGLRITGETLII